MFSWPKLPKKTGKQAKKYLQDAITQIVWLPTRNSTTLGFRRYKQSRDLRVINYALALPMLTVRNSQCLSTRLSQNALQTCKNLNTLISLLIFNSVEKKIVMGPS